MLLVIIFATFISLLGDFLTEVSLRRLHQDLMWKFHGYAAFSVYPNISPPLRLSSTWEVVLWILLTAHESEFSFSICVAFKRLISCFFIPPLGSRAQENWLIF